MRLLLDTHTLLWYDTDASQLSSRVLSLTQKRANEVYVSSLSAWELAIKWKIGRLPLARSLVEDFRGSLEAYGFIELGFGSIHAVKAASYDTLHKDPFDRGLAAQAEVEQLTLLSKDTVLEQFGIHRIW